MGLYQAATGDKITAARWNTIYGLLKGTVGAEDTIKLANNVDDTLLLQPNVAPGSIVDLLRVKSQAGVEKFAVRSDGSLCLADQGGEVGSLENGLIWRNGPKFYGRLDGTTVELFTPAAASIIYAVRIAADVARTAVDFADVSGLYFAVAANKDYFFEAQLIFRTAATTTGIKIGVNGPASPVACCYLAWLAEEAVVKTGQYIGYDQSNVTTGIWAANTDAAARLSGIFRNGANAGTFILRFGSEVAGSEVRIQAGSVLRWQQLN